MGNSFRWRRMAGHEDLMGGIGPESYSMDVARNVTPNVLVENSDVRKTQAGSPFVVTVRCFWVNDCVGRGRSQFPEF